MGPVTECYRCDRAPCSTWNGMAVCGDCLDYYREGAAPFPDESAGSESIASGGSDRHDENSAPAAGSREAATDPPTGLTNPTPDASSSPVPVPVVNEVAEALAVSVTLQHGFDPFSIDHEEALCEGFESVEAFRRTWLDLQGNLDPLDVWRIEFEPVQA